MYLSPRVKKAVINKAYQGGNLLIVTLVIIVVLLVLGLALVRILSASSQQNVIEYYGSRAYLAAQSGLESGLTEIFPLNSPALNCAAVTTSPVFQTQYLENCTVTIACQQYLNVPDTSNSTGAVNIFYLKSSATCSPSSCAIGEPCRKDYWQTQRTVSVGAKTLP
ncbi:agglutinin biogenesis protein MshP [Pseudoalteromonas sp. ZZD1]|uniref:agglutinin biogenesis protein MshP n=1 Tax=Pseudoalteromonas sp. ZZD1 TaxID=3139395 RepID=UPI003BA93D99